MPTDRRGAFLICVMLVSATFLLAGCGGKSSTGTASAGSSGTSKTAKPAETDASSSQPGADASRKQFIARADPICRRFNVELARSSAKGKGGIGNGRERAAYVAGLLKNETIERRANSELARLAQPPALTADWGEMLADRRLLAKQLGELATALVRKNKVSEQELVNRKKEWHQALRQVAVKAGFKDCARVG